MTGKRFKIADYPTDIEDTVTGEKYPCSSYGTHMEIICDLLNELNDENQKLKLENDGLRYALKNIKQIDVEIDIGDCE
jgi:regulator of replication initiation timing